MARRSTVDRSPRPDMHTAGCDPAVDLTPDGGGNRQRGAPGWRGAGGRWLVWLFRAVAWVVLIVIGYRGVTAIVFNETPPSRSPVAAPTAGSKFPVELAAAYALQFGQVYLNFNPASAAQRAGALAPFLPASADPQLGWDGSGSLQLQSEQVAGVEVRDTHHAVVTLLARVNGHLMELGVPVYAGRGGISVSGEPAWLPAPARAVPPAPAAANIDEAAQAELTKQLPAFFQAYASGSQVTLARFLVPGTVMSGLGGQVAFRSLAGVTAPPGGPTRQITATVVWRIPAYQAAASPVAVAPASLEMTYSLTITKQHGTWYVRNVSPSSQVAGQP